MNYTLDKEALKENAHPKDLNIFPYEKKPLENMFNKIAPRYDFLNQLFSFGNHKRWRHKAIQLLKSELPKFSKEINPFSLILDIATGTGDFAIESVDLKPRKIIGLDNAGNMLAMARKKIERKKLTQLIDLIKADAEHIPFPENFFDAATIGYGTKNFEDLKQGLSEIYRVMKKDATVAIVEYSIPEKTPLKQIYKFYLEAICPLPGKLISRNNVALQHLSTSITNFPQGENYKKILLNCGFSDVRVYPQTFGLSIIYLAKK